MTHAVHSVTSLALSHEPSVGGNVTAVGLVGREEQLRELAGLLVPHRDDGAAIVLTGEPGIGKSTLLEAARAADLDCRPSARARLALAEGLWLARTGQNVRARQILRGAATLFDALGMRPWSKKASASVS